MENITGLVEGFIIGIPVAVASQLLFALLMAINIKLFFNDYLSYIIGLLLHIGLFNIGFKYIKSDIVYYIVLLPIYLCIFLFILIGIAKFIQDICTYRTRLRKAKAKELRSKMKNPNKKRNKRHKSKKKKKPKAKAQ